MPAQGSLIYSLVARGTVVLVEYTEFSGNFPTIGAYCVVAVESAGRELPIAFLERIKDDFVKKYAAGKGKTAGAKSLSKEFGPKMKEQMRYCVSHPEEISKIAKVKAQVSEVKGVMMENIEKVLERGEKIELLVDKTDNLRNQAQDFKKQGTKMKRKMWVENMKVKLIVFSIVVALALVVILSICPGFKCF
ncbi:putative Longin domain, v-SNARE, coiled-coil domain-containing protein [Helianthus annuus]|nr:putative Longin domain, v-SNARE, coiled-coil domain-containing protein [Helianthus annuus]